MDPRLDFFLDRVSSRLQRFRLAWLLSLVWLIVAIVLIVASTQQPLMDALMSQQKNSKFGLAVFAAVFALVMTFVATAVWLFVRFGFRDRRWLAIRVEKRYPSLDHRLITAIAVETQSSSDFLRRMLVDETVLHAATHDWRQVVSNRWMFLAWGMQTLSLSAVIGSLVFIATNHNFANDLQRKVLPLLGISPAMIVEPGDAEIERGTSCLVTARFEGEVPPRVSMRVSTATKGESSQELTRSLNDPVFGGYLTRVEEDLTYCIESKVEMSRGYTLRVFDYPTLVRSDAQVKPAKYTRQAQRTIEDTRRVTLPEGSELTWLCHVNKPDIQAKLVQADGASLAFHKDESDPLIMKLTVVVDQNTRWTLRLVDSEGREAKIDETFFAKVTPNQPPEIKIQDGGDLTVSPLEEIDISAIIREDFGLERAGVAYQLGEEAFTEVVLRESELTSKPSMEATTPLKNPEAIVSQRLDFEAMKAEPDQLLSYFFWAEDLDKDGKTRRVDGEIFFAETRPFDEIYREGKAPSGDSPPSESQQAQQAEELAELQKKIISGTWNLLRKEWITSPSHDIQVVLDSQNEALGLTEPLAEKLSDAISKQHLVVSQQAMSQAIEQLKLAAELAAILSSRAALREALTFERQAYERLLKLRAREHEIVKSKQSQSKSKSTSQKNRQQQLDQLKLDDNEERYETENQAAPEKQSEDRELRQVMNRLEELARRQEDLNRQLKDLETAIQEAKSPEKKKELEEQLKRLRENQNDLLRDSDELLEKMQQAQSESENREPMREAQEQVEQARENVKQASQALSESNPSPSQALAAGSRAERQFNETREQLREQSAERFEETLESMLSEAKELEKKQKELNKNSLATKESSPSDLTETSATETSGLRSNNTGEPANEEDRNKAWREQSDRLNRLWDRMEETVAEAEPSEPLLAEKLYETFRSSKQRGLDERMELIPQLIERGYEEPVHNTLEEIESGVAQLRQGVESAAEAVLGSEEAGLRRALDELTEAERQLQEERNRASSGSSTKKPETSPSSNPNQQANNQATVESETPSSNGSSRPKLQQLGSPGERNEGPFTGGGFAEWSDRLREVEESIRDPELRASTSSIRQAAREAVREARRHASEPQWDMIEKMVAEPLSQLRESVQRELLKRTADRNAVVPIDRDPVPANFEEQLRRYYENLSSLSHAR